MIKSGTTKTILVLIDMLSLLQLMVFFQTLFLCHVDGSVQRLKGRVEIEGSECERECDRTAKTHFDFNQRVTMRQRWRLGDDYCYGANRTIHGALDCGCVHMTGTSIPCQYSIIDDEYVCTVDRQRFCGIVMLQLAYTVLQRDHINLKLGGQRTPPDLRSSPAGRVIKQYYNYGNVMNTRNSFKIFCRTHTCLEDNVRLFTLQYDCTMPACQRTGTSTEC